MELIESALRLSTPLLFAALAGVLSERAGVINIALEAKLLAGAFAAMAVTAASGQPWPGIAAAAAFGLLIGLAHAGLVLKLRVDAILSGVGLNLLALGFTTYLLQSAFTREGVGIQVRGPAPWFPALGEIPILGTLAGGGTPFVPLALAAVGGVWVLLYRTRAGLHLRALGEAPRAALAAGLPVARLRTLWVALAGALAGIGGAYLTLEAAGRFTQNASAGRGYLALAAVIFGRWHPLGAAAAVFFFGFGEALQISLQGHRILGVGLPSELLSALPYLLGLLALAGVLGRVTPPAGLGQAP